MPFLVIFVLIPLAEITVFIAVSDKIGLGTALLMALLTAILGGIIVRYQGIHTIMNAQQSLEHGQIPSKEIFNGLCLVAAGATLITPGFITDALGFSLLVPAIRDALRKKISESTRFQSMEFNADYTEFHDTKHYHRPKDPNVIEADYETVDDTDKP